VTKSLKTLHISGIFEALDEHDAFYAFLQHSFTATSALASNLEELILACPGTQMPHFPRQFASWYMHDLSHLESLHYLHLSSCLFHLNILLRAPSSLETLILDIHPFKNRHSDFDYFQQDSKFDLEDLLSALCVATAPANPPRGIQPGAAPNLKSVILQVEGETMEEGWEYLADKCKTFWFEEGQFQQESLCACEVEYHHGHVHGMDGKSFIGADGGIDGGIAAMSYVEVLKREIGRKAKAAGLEVRLELKRGELSSLLSGPRLDPDR